MAVPPILRCDLLLPPLRTSLAHSPCLVYGAIPTGASSSPGTQRCTSGLVHVAVPPFGGATCYFRLCGLAWHTAIAWYMELYPLALVAAPVHEAVPPGLVHVAVPRLLLLAERPNTGPVAQSKATACPVQDLSPAGAMKLTPARDYNIFN